jgi:hypothetical protein
MASEKAQMTMQTAAKINIILIQVGMIAPPTVFDICIANLIDNDKCKYLKLDFEDSFHRGETVVY